MSYPSRRKPSRKCKTCHDTPANGVRPSMPITTSRIFLLISDLWLCINYAQRRIHTQFMTRRVLGGLQQHSLHRSTPPPEPERACIGSCNRSLFSQRTAALALDHGTEIIRRNPAEIDSTPYVGQRLACRWPSSKVFGCLSRHFRVSNKRV